RTERDAEARARLVQLPMDLAALRAPLGHFVEVLGRPALSGLRARLRGCYVTSAGDPARAAGDARSPDAVASFSLRDALRRVVLPDQALATRSAIGATRRAAGDLRAAVATFAGAAVVL